MEVFTWPETDLRSLLELLNHNCTQSLKRLRTHENSSTQRSVEVFTRPKPLADLRSFANL